MKMRTMLILTLLSVGLLLAGTGIAGAGVIVSTGVPTTATLQGVNTLSVTPMIYAAGSAPSISFGTVSSTVSFLVPAQYVRVVHNDNSLAWEIKIHTNNFGVNVDTWDPYDPAKYGVTPATATWGFQYGGMKGSPGAKTPMGWHARVDNSLASKFAAGDPAATTSVGWNFVKDHADRDDPSTTVDTPPIGVVKDESYKGANGKASYANVAYGGPGYQNVVNPQDLIDYSDPDTDKTFVVEVEGCFGSAPADTYSTTLYFDLVHQ